MHSVSHKQCWKLFLLEFLALCMAQDSAENKRFITVKGRKHFNLFFMQMDFLINMLQVKIIYF